MCLTLHTVGRKRLMFSVPLYIIIKLFVKKFIRPPFIRNTTESQSKISRMKMLSLEQSKEAHQGMFLASNGDICF